MEPISSRKTLEGEAIFRACFAEPNPIPAKAALAQLGLMSAAVRLPLSPATEATVELMNNVLSELWKK